MYIYICIQVDMFALWLSACLDGCSYATHVHALLVPAVRRHSSSFRLDRLALLFQSRDRKNRSRGRSTRRRRSRNLVTEWMCWWAMWNKHEMNALESFSSISFHSCFILEVACSYPFAFAPCPQLKKKKSTRLNWYKWARMKHKFNIVIKVYSRLKCLPTNHAQRTDHLRWSEDLEFRRHQAIWEAVWLEIWEVVTEHGFVSKGKLSDRVLRVRCFSVQY